MLNVVILAAGKGTRMKSSLPKVLHPVAGRPMLSHTVDTARALEAGAINLVVGHGAEAIQARLDGADLNFVLQAEQLGTGHAVQQALPHLQRDDTVLILYGDVPLIQASTLSGLCEKVSDNSLAILTVPMADPSGYGRILRDAAGQVSAIVEQKDATPEQLAINEVNTGIMAVKGSHLQQWLPRLSNDNAQGEYYLTDLIALAREDGVAIASENPGAEWEVLGINNRVQQAELERIYQREQATAYMRDGLSLRDPARFDCRGDLSFGRDVEVDINCVFEGRVVLGNNVRIGPNCYLRDAQIGDNCVIQPHTMLEEARLAESCEAGPFARLRPGSELANGAKVGNFVEMKKARLGERSKANHLSYVGDANVGRDANIGAGTITCNYDGANKSQTDIGDGAFIGSNTALVAPVRVGSGATVGAGSTVNKDVPDEHLAVARGRQRNIEGWERPKKDGSSHD